MSGIHIVSYSPASKDEATVFLPASKSISNRLLIIKALSGYLDNIHNLSTAQDTETLLEIIKNVNRREHNARLGGTTFRFLLAYLSLLKNEFVLTAEGKMNDRPITPLVDALNRLGAEIEYLNETGKPPLLIKRGNMHGGKITINASASSQFVSAIMLISPYLKNGVTLVLEGEIVSKPYIEMTAKLMQTFGAEVSVNYPQIHIKEGKYSNKTYFVENDWSAASYFYQSFLFAEKPQQIKIPYLYKNSIQGDVAVSHIYRYFGIETGFTDDAVILTKRKENELPAEFTYDFTHTPDLAQTLAVTCALLKIPATLTGLQTLQYKETNRIEALQQELKKINVSTRFDNHNVLSILPSGTLLPASYFQTYNDHRMAMALAAVAQVTGQIKMEHPGVVKKSFPHFWDEIKKLGVILS